ncbi:hypothetical protein [Stenotrophomonas geniculata]|uniref:hypothetical protein n=1 Tax=Stenotrophomonas geniculata TaxID=86188 RepID=UPI002E779603|nr:hypothetical protein [Stenotrophomonas geniculata]
MTARMRERLYPYLCGAAAFGVVLFLKENSYTISYSENMLSAVISLGGIFAGFLATIKTLLLTISSDVKDRLTVSGYMKDLLAYLREGIYGSLILCVVAMLGFSGAMRWPDYHAAVLYGALLFSVAALYRISRISISLLTWRSPQE